MRELLERLNNLKRVPRTGWLLCGTPIGEVEDVAQHSFEVAAITLLLARELEREGKKLDRERALSMAVLHDWAEALAGDFPYTALKYLGQVGSKPDIERRALEDLLRDLPGREEYLGLWREYQGKGTVEARLVHAADYLSMLVQAVKYREGGNRSSELDELWRAVHADLEPYADEFSVVRRMIQELDERYAMPSATPG